MSRRRAAGLLLAALLVAGGCVNYPKVIDIGGIRLQPTNGKAVRDGAGALFYVDIRSIGMFGDVLVRVETEVARSARLVDAAGAPLARLTVPGNTEVRLAPGGRRVVLSDLTRELKQGEVVIVTLVFEKSGAIGVISPVE